MYGHMIHLAVWALCCFCGIASAANTLPYPDLRFIRHDGPDGPFRQSFSRLHVDRDGFLWGATLDSVFRFDGHQFQQWPVQGGISAAFSEDAAGRLWVMTEQELWRFDRERVVRERIALPMLRQNWGIELAHGPQGPWLVTSDGQLFRYSASDEQFKVHWKSASKKPVLDARSTSRGVLWWVTDTALWRFSPGEDRTPRAVKHFSSVPRLHTTPLVIESPQGEMACISSRTGIECVREDGSALLSHRSVPPCTALQVDTRQRLHALCGDTVWSQTSGQTGHLDASIKLPHPAREGINEIQVDANGRLWFSLGDAFGIYDLETRSYQSVPVGMEDETGRSLPAPVFATNRMLASGGNIWFALNGKGLYRASLAPLPFEHWAPLADSGAANSPLLRALYEDRNAQGRQLWLADARSSIWRIPLDKKGQLKAGIPVSVTSPSSTSECRALVRSPEGVMLYATADRLFAYNAQANAFNPVSVQWPSSAPAMRPCGLHRDMHDQLWMYGSHGIAHLRPDGAGGYRAEVHASQSNSAWDLFDGLYEGSDGWWWIPGRNGIRRFDPKQRRWQILARPDAPLGAEWIHQVVEQPVGVYWLATRGGGLQRIDLRTGDLSDRRRWSEVVPPPESQSPIRYSILPDVKGNLWLAGGRGLDRYDPRRGHWLHFDTSSGLQQLEFNHGAAAKLSDGRLVFVGLNGLTIVRPEFIDDQRPPPMPQWRGVQVEGGPLRNAGHRLALAYDKRALTVHYLALDYDSPRAIRYRYRLHPDAEWIDVGDQRQLHFAELAGGEYRLELQAAYNNVDWPARGIGLQIHIASPWYQRWMTWLLFGLLLSAIAAGYVIARNRRQRILEAEISEKTKELRVAAEELSSSYVRLSDSNAALQRSHDEIQEKKGRLELALGARERLFRQVSHELRNPLTNIVLPLDDMITHAGSTVTGERLIAMRRNAERLKEMVEALLDKAKAESEVRLQLEAICVSAEIVAIVHDSSAMFVARNQSLSMACDIGNEVEANLSRDCLPVILGNLLANASKYTPEGGQVRMFAHVLGGMLMIQVTDTGVGMDEKTCAKIYSPFFRGANAHASGVAGYGLGLHLVHDLVHRHGGDLGVESAPGKGTTFTVRLPIKTSGRALDQADPNNRATVADEMPALPASFHAGSSQSHGNHRTLLVIEDDMEIRAMLVERLSIHYRCLDAADGESALEEARQHLPDLILCDIDLPGMSGYDVCLSLKSSEQTAHIPIVFLTAYAGDGARLQGLRVHGDDYIVKPPSMDELRLKIENRFRTRDALLSRARTGNPPDLALPDVSTKDQDFIAKALKLKIDIDNAVSTHYRSPDFSVAMLARILHRSTRTLQRQMEQYGIGVPPLEYLRNYRLGLAAELLRGNRKVADVAEACGLDPRTFSDYFKLRYEKTPSEWRKSNLGQDPDDSL